MPVIGQAQLMNGRLAPSEDPAQYKEKIRRQEDEIRALTAQLAAVKVGQSYARLFFLGLKKLRLAHWLFEWKMS